MEVDKMCGRFYVDDEMLNEIHKICRKIDENYHHRSGDIRPSEKALIIKKDIDSELCAMSGIWGYQLKERKQLLINARVETIHLKPIFRDDYRHHRCVIPISGFYEWNQEKVQYRCKPMQNQKILYLAGIYSEEDEGSRFTIITTQANKIMKTVHERMPVVIPEKNLSDWLTYLKTSSKLDSHAFQIERVNRGVEYQQMSFLQ